MSSQIRILSAAALLVAGTTGAEAALRVCNETNSQQSVSIGYKGTEDWTSEGWWNIEPGDCATVIADPLENRYYYLRAERNAGPFQGDGYSFCTTPTEYTIVGDTECEARGYDQEDFVEIDTGAEATEYTYTLEQAAMDTAQAGSDPYGLRICNETDAIQSVSVGYKTDDGFVSEGWWNADPGGCVTPIAGALKLRYYYLRAEVDGGDFAGDGYFFCTTPQAYTIEGERNCEARGYDSEDFREIDTGTDAREFTYTLVAADAASGDDGGTGADDTEEPAVPAASGLTFCNDSAEAQSVSVGYEGAEGWTSEGWWNVSPGACTTTLLGPLDRQYYYWRAEVEGGPFQGDGYSFCTTPDAYTIVGDTECEARGYETEDFAEVDIGAGATAYTVRIAAAPPAPDDGAPPAPDETGEVTDDITLEGAGLEVCNDTADAQSLAFGYDGVEGWTSEGWWNIDPGACTTPALDGTPRRYFYYRAEVDGGDFVGQSYFFCTRPEAFTIVGDSNCEARGYDREDFREIDTGGTEGMFTFRLVAAADTPPADDGAPADDTAPPAPGTVTGDDALPEVDDDPLPEIDDLLPGGDEPAPAPRRGGSRTGGARGG